MHVHRSFSFLCLCLSFLRAGALFGYGVSRCQLTSTNESVYLEQFYINKMFLGQYNSTSGKFSGSTEKMKEIADKLNKNPSIMNDEKRNLDKCKTFLPPAVEALSKSVEPYIRLTSHNIVSSNHPNMLICSAYNFYPKKINVTWLRDGKIVTSDVSSTEELSNGNWLYQIHSLLEYTPRSGEKITCMVEHASFKEPKLYDWDPMPQSQRNKVAVGTAGLVLGLVFLLAGLIYYKKNAVDRVLVPSS
ncbi:rano class II histocompatibility antigen, A beta chain-like [Echeneis naucrates]|uniref:Rano class II histocompatibility antigen, A beta chain-like n=1 Tax=Echeneis naucrates TaxID=173247 RepID=A0A665UH10_ECHNA|nr:rano class II histocompatibility antigen, A beta chain-like [Echeneis naucrates]